MNASVLPEVKAQADLGTARVLVAQGKSPDAETLLRKLVTQDLPGGVLAAAWNGLGDLVLDQGKKATVKDADKFLEARLRLPAQRGAVPAAHRRGHPRIRARTGRFGLVLPLHRRSGAESDRKELYTQRYKARVELLRHEYPDSVFLAGL